MHKRKAASASSFFDQLQVEDPAELKRWLESAQPKWLEGRLAYLGIILYTEAQQDQVQKLLQASKPPIEPLLTLAITLEWAQGKEQLELPVSLVMKMKAIEANSFEASNLEVGILARRLPPIMHWPGGFRDCVHILTTNITTLRCF